VSFEIFEKILTIVNMRFSSLQITFPHACNNKKFGCFDLLDFHKSSNRNLNFSPTEACYQKWQNICLRAMVAERKLRLATNIIFITVVAYCSQ